MKVTVDPRLKSYLELRDKALRSHDAKAMYQLARIYSNSGEPDAAGKAFELYKRSAAHRFAEAQYMMGVCYETGTGVKRSYVRAIDWYERTSHAVSCDLMDNPGPIDKAENEIIRMYFENPQFAPQRILRNCQEHIVACRKPRIP